MTSSPSVFQPFFYQDFQEAATSIVQGLQQHHAYMSVVGESGSGKTSLLLHLQRSLDKQAFTVLYLCHHQSSSAYIPGALAHMLQLPQWHSRVKRAHLLTAALKNLSSRLLVWIDEAQTLPINALHDLRVLAEADLGAEPLFWIILCGLPGVEELLHTPELLPVRRRIRTRVRLRGLQHEEVTAFVNHALGEGTAARFSPEALSVLLEQARGLPAMLRNYTEFCLQRAPTTDRITKQLVVDLLDDFQSP